MGGYNSRFPYWNQVITYLLLFNLLKIWISILLSVVDVSKKNWLVANSLDPDQISCGIWSWSTLFAQACQLCLTHCSRETPKRVIDKQCRPRSDVAKRGVWLGSPLFANSLAIFLMEYLKNLI